MVLMFNVYFAGTSNVGMNLYSVKEYKTDY